MSADSPRLCRITIFPIKSLDGMELDLAGVLAGGALAGDRRWAIVDRQGRWINGKRTPAVHPIRASYSAGLEAVALQRGSGPAETFALPGELARAAAWLSEALGMSCRLIENAQGGFPDDDLAPGPTLVGRGSLAAVASWYEGLDEAEMRRRIRANLEIDGVEPFWEDRLGDDGQRSPRFAVGSVVYRGRTICQRCIVPTRDARSAEPTPAFAVRFARERQRQLPGWAPTEQFDHYYRLALNTAVERVGGDGVLRLGDAVAVLERG